MKTLLLAIVFFALNANAQTFDHSHAAWSALLKKHVVLVDGGKASQVRYVEFARDRAALKAYLDALSAVPEAEFRGWTKPQQMSLIDFNG